MKIITFIVACTISTLCAASIPTKHTKQDPIHTYLQEVNLAKIIDKHFVAGEKASDDNLRLIVFQPTKPVELKNFKNVGQIYFVFDGGDEHARKAIVSRFNRGLSHFKKVIYDHAWLGSTFYQIDELPSTNIITGLKAVEKKHELNLLGSIPKVEHFSIYREMMSKHFIYDYTIKVNNQPCADYLYDATAHKASNQGGMSGNCRFNFPAQGSQNKKYFYDDKFTSKKLNAISR